MGTTKRLHLVSGPRNISTALMYSFGNRTDCTVVDEPLYAHYLLHTETDHPGKEEILQSMSGDAGDVIKNVILRDYPTPLLFIKNMAHHLSGCDTGFMSGVTNIFLIRDVSRVIRSISRIIDQPVMRDIGIQREWELYSELKESGNDPVVIDSDRLLAAPEQYLKELCRVVDISFDPAMLEWKAGPRKEDGVWAKYWYKNVHKSTGFSSTPLNTEHIKLEGNAADLYDEALPYFEQLRSLAIDIN